MPDTDDSTIEPLQLHGRRVATVFDLLGNKENDMTRALGWTLANCPKFLQRFTRRIMPGAAGSRATVELQVWEKPKGYTDVELVAEGKFHFIIEAKRGWQPPELPQLKKYAGRLQRSPSPRIVVLTDWSYTAASSSLKKVAGIPVVWISWAEVLSLAAASRKGSPIKQRHWLEELIQYLGGVSTMQEVDSNWVYIVSLAAGKPQGSKISWIDIVEKKHRYFHPPQGGGWPKTAPNYLAWRHHGKLQGIAHIEKYEIVKDLHSKIPEISPGKAKNLVLYRLGTTFRPANPVATGKIYRSNRVRCMLDTLFTSDTISEAYSKSKKREAAAKRTAS
jgi:hypothetical protein